MEAPLRQLASNAGREGALIVAKVKGMKKAADGYNVATDKYEDLLTAGVVDPTKVTRSALQNAASIAGLLLTTECVIADKPEKKGCGCGSGAPDMGGMGGMGGMGMMGNASLSEGGSRHSAGRDFRKMGRGCRRTGGKPGSGSARKKRKISREAGVALWFLLKIILLHQCDGMFTF